MFEKIRKSPAARRFFSDWTAVAGLTGVVFIAFMAVAAPLLANGRPLVMWHDGLSFPFLRYFFAPDSSESLVEKFFNFWLIFLPLWFPVRCVFRRKKTLSAAVLALAVILPFCLIPGKMDRTNYKADGMQQALYAPIPYGPYEIAGVPYETPGRKHWLGTDEIGRDVASRLIYGARISLAVGLAATVIAMAAGCAVGLLAGYMRGVFDLLVMRMADLITGVPVMLLLLILMALLRDRGFEQQSVLPIVLVLAFSDWIGVAFLVRGETLRQRALPFIESCITAGMPVGRTLWRQMLPNISGPVLIRFSFSVAGAILAESGLSFLGFGVLPPTASWGGFLRQAFDDPFSYWHLMLFPGIALFISAAGFNLIGEGLRKALDVRLGS